MFYKLSLLILTLTVRFPCLTGNKDGSLSRLDFEFTPIYFPYECYIH